MNYMWKFMSNFKEFYNEINSATLTGAIDVIVIEQENGSYLSSPFHVRFGKIGVLRSREKVVDIEVNGEPVDIHMKLGETGEAFFVEESDDSIAFPSYLATSPIPSYPDIGENLKKERAFKPPEDPPPDGNQWETEQSPPGPLVIQSAPCSSSVSSGFDPDVVIPISDENFHSFDQKSGESLTGGMNDEASVHRQSPGVVDVTAVGSSGISSAIAEEACFRPIKNDAFEEVVIVEDTSDLGTMDSGSTADDDRFKSGKKKKRRRSTLRRKQQQLQDINYDADACHASRETPCLMRSSEEVHEDGIFHMDVDEDSVKSIDGDELHTRLTSAEVPSSGSQDVVDCASWQYKSVSSEPYGLYPMYNDGERSLPLSPRESRPSTPKSDTEYEMRRLSCESDADEHRWSWTWGELPVPPKIPAEKEREEPFSDDDSTDKAKQIKKDQEEQRSMLGGVLQFMRMSKKEGHHKADSEGMYLDDLMADDVDPEIANLYLSRNSTTLSSHQRNRNGQAKDDDAESGNGSSLPHSPHSIEGGISGGMGPDSDSEGGVDMKEEFQGIAFSLCGNLSQFVDGIPHDKFNQRLVSYRTFCSTPNIFENPDLVVRINEKYYNWQTAAPMLMSVVLFQRPLPKTVVSTLVKDHMPKKQKKPESRGYSWFSWRRSAAANQGSDNKSAQELADWSQGIDENKDLGQRRMPPTSLQTDQQDFSSENTETSRIANTVVDSVKESVVEFEDQLAEQEMKLDDNGSILENRTETYKKSLRLSSEQIAQLKLKEGPNEAVFSVTTAYQGTTRCKCHIYLWKHDDQIIISDIDGTITKSDVLGHILPIVGKSWAQSGVAQLFTTIKDNGYQFLYLSARAIGQARITRDYLRSIRQGDVSLPDGPLLLSPSSLISALHREVIEKKPEEFKISCLRDIQALFPTRNPFYAGYGNKINDVWAYRAVGIPMSRIFTINHKGELKHELNCTFQSSYSGLTYVVDHLFPPLRRTKFSNGYLSSDFIEAEEFSSFTYWRSPVPDLEIDLDTEKSKGSDISDETK